MAKVVLDKSKYHVLSALLWQLRFVPPSTLLEQTYRAERLLRLIDTSKRYPYDFVCYKLTDYKPKEVSEIEPLPGDKLQADLAQFIADVSSQYLVGTDQLPERVCLLSDIAEQAGVSVKTLQRWRKFGLPCRFATVDGRQSAVVFAATWEWFMDRHEKRVARAAAFSRVSVGRRRWVVREARKLVQGGDFKRSHVEKLLGERIGRAPETVRYILKRHDALAGPEDRVFATRRKLTDADRETMLELFGQGVTAEALAGQYGRSISSIYRVLHEQRQVHWRKQDLEFVFSPEFDLPNAADTISPAVNLEVKAKPGSDGHLEVLTQPQERLLFKAYNYLKSLQSEQISPYREGRAIPAYVLDHLDELEAKLQVVRAKLILANQALIISIAKRHVQPGLTLDELVSEGMTPLMKAVEKFDYAKGFKFSTYASWAIMKHYARLVPEEGARHRQEVSLAQEDLELVLPGAEDIDEAGAFRRSEAVQNALSQLDDREKHILTNRYRLDRVSEPMSLAALGVEFGISKERVRQIESRAMKKMHSLLEAVLPGSD